MDSIIICKQEMQITLQDIKYDRRHGETKYEQQK